MYTKLLKSITSLSLIGGALLYTNGSDVKAAEVGVFSDVPTSHWSYPAIKDLASKNIISGYGNGIFGFGDVATREQVAALIYRVFWFWRCCDKGASCGFNLSSVSTE